MKSMFKGLQKVSDLFKSRQDQWIDSDEIQAVGGQNAWRTRVSECRTILGMTVANRQSKREDGTILSQYSYRVASC